MDKYELSDLIGQIYDCALDPERWSDVIGRMACAVDAAAGMVALHDLQANRGIRTFSSGMPMPIMRLYAARFATTNPIAQVATTRTEGDVDTLATMFSDDTWERSSVNRYMLRPLGLRDVLGMAVLRSNRRGVWLGTFRRGSAGDFGPQQVELFRLLAPHIIRSMRISDILDLQVVALDRLAAVIDRLSTAVFLVDGVSRVVHHNTAAEALLDRCASLTMSQGRLTATSPSARADLAAAIEAAVSDGFCRIPMQQAVPLGDGALGRGAIATVLPLGRGQHEAHEAAAAVFVQDAVATPLVLLEAFGALYGLTPTEQRFLGALMAGRTVSEAAAVLNVRESTAKTHLKNMFQKTGTCRQVELMRLVMALSAPIRG